MRRLIAFTATGVLLAGPALSAAPKMVNTYQDWAVYTVDDKNGWIAGQEGLILHTGDGGKTWQLQESNASFKDSDGATKRAYLFSLDAIDANTETLLLWVTF